jgi:hypothetical protein
MGAAMKTRFRRRETGQALVEFLVAAIVIVPLFILLPLLGKYHDVKQSSIAASRKLAFECTVRYEDCASLNSNPAFADEIRTRFYAGNREPVLSNDRPGADALANANGNPLWRDRAGRPLLERYSDVGIRADARNVNPGAASLANVAGIGPDGFGLDLRRGAFDARVQVALSRQNGGQNFLNQLDSLALTMQFHTAILTNAWDASGPGTGGHRCQPNSNTVAGRTSEQALCYGPFPTMDAGHNVLVLLMTPLGIFENNDIGEFDFHRFVDAEFADDVPRQGDHGGFPRTERPR